MCRHHHFHHGQRPRPDADSGRRFRGATRAPSHPVLLQLQHGRLLSDRAGAGSDVASMSTTAKRDGDSYILNGTKTFITNGSVASLYTVFATRDKSLRHQGIAGFIVPAETRHLAWQEIR